MLNIFSSMKYSIQKKVINKEPGLYFYLVFPIATSFLITFVLARVFNHLFPWLYIVVSPGVHIHHFTYGFFILAISGYLALIHRGPRASYLIALFHGAGLGLSFDEFGMWLRLQDDGIVRWSYDGFMMMMGLFLFLLSAKRGIKMLRILWPFNKGGISAKD